MIKKILSSLIIIMIICSTCVCATNVIIPVDIGNSSQEQEITNLEDSITNNNSENQNTDTNTDTDGNNGENSYVNNDTNASDNTNTNEGTDTENNENTNNNNQNENTNNQTGSNIEPPKQDTEQVATQNNQGTSNNSIKTKSSEARLKALKVDIEGLTPYFDKDTTEYYLVIDLSVEQIKVTAKAVDDEAKVTVTGNKKLEEGENTITINVKAEDGTTKKYYIYVTKIDDLEMTNAKLESLEIEGFNIYPTFKSNIYSYNLNITENIKDLNITAVPQREKATVQIEGNKNLQEGENIIKITVTAENEITVRTYKINTFINSERVKLEEESKLPAIILISILGVGIIVLGVFIVIRNRR